MKHLILLIIGFILTINMFAQNSDSLVISKIDLIITDIDNNSDYLRLHEDGELSKKKMLFFNKTIGGYYSNIVYKDSLILSTENKYYYNKNDRTHNEKFYFSDNKIIKYIEEVYIKRNLKHKIEIYYKGQEIIKVDQEINDSFKLDNKKKKFIIEKSKREISLRQMTTNKWKQLHHNKSHRK